MWFLLMFTNRLMMLKSDIDTPRWELSTSLPETNH